MNEITITIDHAEKNDWYYAFVGSTFLVYNIANLYVLKSDHDADDNVPWRVILPNDATEVD